MSEVSETIDERVLELRGQGQAYARISRDLGLDRAADAQQAFRRALLRLPAMGPGRGAITFGPLGRAGSHR